VQAVLGLPPHRRARPVDDRGADLLAAVGRQAVEDDRDRRAEPEEGVVDLVADEGGAPRLGRLLEELCVSAEATGAYVVLRTPPGGAHFLAAAIDRAGLPDIAGTVAGDDTVLLITRTPATPAAGALADRLLRLADGR
jgi:transcriptional regulator of arginine metabolism